MLKEHFPNSLKQCLRLGKSAWYDSPKENVVLTCNHFSVAACSLTILLIGFSCKVMLSNRKKLFL